MTQRSFFNPQPHTDTRPKTRATGKPNFAAASSHAVICLASAAVFGLGLSAAVAQTASGSKRNASQVRASAALSKVAPSPTPKVELQQLELPKPTVGYVIQNQDELAYLIKSVGNAARWQQIAYANFLPTHNTIALRQVIEVPAAWLSLDNSLEVVANQGIFLQTALPKATGSASAPIQSGGYKFETGPKSNATVRLADNTVVKLLPNTIAEIPKSYKIQLQTQDDPNSGSSWAQSAIRVLQGVIEVVSGKNTQRIEPIDVRTPTSILGVRGTSFRVAFDPATNTSRHEVTEGLVGLETVRTEQDKLASGLPAQVPAGYGSVLKGTDTRVVVQPLLPAPQVMDYHLVCTPIFNFAATPKAVAYHVQIADDTEFEKIKRIDTLTTPALDFSALPNQRYYVKVRAVAADGLEGVDRLSEVDFYENCQHRYGKDYGKLGAPVAAN